MPSPVTYNLSYLKSIQEASKANEQAIVRDRLRAQKRYDRFGQKTYFKELDRGNGDHSPGPCAYQASNVAKLNLPSVRRSSDYIFSKADRGLKLKKEKKESPSPTKYNVQYEFKGTRNIKGASFGTAAKKFSMF